MSRTIPWFSYFSTISIAPLTKWLFVKEIRGKENLIQLNRNFILASNHQSYLDVFINGSLCVPKRFHFIGQIDSWHGISKFLVRAFYFVADVIPLNRENEESRKKIVEKATEFLKKGDILIVYPEGTRSLDGKIQEGKPGIAKIFLKTGVPILPVGLKGTFELFPPKGKLKINKSATVNIGKPLFFKEELKEAESLEENSKEYFSLLQKITDKIMEEIKNLTIVP